jgi:hypothetical protein
MTVINLLFWVYLLLAMVCTGASLIVHAYRRYKGIESPKRWILFEILLVMPISLGLLFLAFFGDLEKPVVSFQLSVIILVLWLVGVFVFRVGVFVFRLIVEIFHRFR